MDSPNTLYYGDNLDILRNSIADASVDLIYLDPATGPMRTEAVEAGFYHSPGWDRDYPRVQILTVEELMAGTQPQIPYGQTTFARAGRVRRAGGQQPGLDLG